MLDLKIIIEKYPHCLGTRSQLVALLRDLYPSEKRSVNVAVAVYDSGIVSRIAQLKIIDTVQLYKFIKLLVDEFGLQEQFAEEGIEIWAKAYEVSFTKDNSDQSLVTSPNNTEHDLDAYAKPVTVNGVASDYELEHRPEGVVISKFRGFDEEDTIIPNIIEGETIIGVGAGAFQNCTAIKTLVISEGIEFVGDRAFANCENLVKVIFPNTLNSIGVSSFEESGITSISLPSGLKKLGEYAFRWCYNLVTVDMPNELTVIEKRAFCGCCSLLKLILPVYLSKIENDAFIGCSKLNYIQFPLSLREIGNSAFKSCSELSVVVLNEGLIKIGSSAFNDCANLSKILIPNTVSDIEEDYDSIDLFTINSWYQPSDGRMNGWYNKRKNSKLTVYCYSGSYGLEYARKKGYPIQNAANFSN